jgi:hypothetical protein
MNTPVGVSLKVASFKSFFFIILAQRRVKAAQERQLQRR